jgi:serine/threonine protein kinase
MRHKSVICCSPKTYTLQVNIIIFILNTDEELSRFLITEKMATNVKTLMFDNHFIQTASAARRCDHFCSSVLKALDYLGVHELIHRDIKPENIFASPSSMHEGDFDYKLGDFGLTESVAFATNDRGSHYFKAPETRSSRAQMPNADVYCLYATLVMIKDVQGFRRYSLPQSTRPEWPDLNNEDVMALIESTRKHPALVKWAKMADQDPQKRPDAGDVLNEYFKDVGRTLVTEQIMYKRKVFAEICRPMYGVATPQSPPETREAAERKRKLDMMAMGADNPAQYEVTVLDGIDTHHEHLESEMDHPNKKPRLGDPDPEVLTSLSDTQLDKYILVIRQVQKSRDAYRIDTNFSKDVPSSLTLSGYADAVERRRAGVSSPGDDPKFIPRKAVPRKCNARKGNSKKTKSKTGLTSTLESARV